MPIFRLLSRAGDVYAFSVTHANTRLTAKHNTAFLQGKNCTPPFLKRSSTAMGTQLLQDTHEY